MKLRLLFGLLPSLALAQNADVADLSLESLLDTPVEVTRDARSSRESASVLLVVTRDEVLSSGARDLLEVLQLVPGFTFHQDVQGVVGVAFRGLWGSEGKVLIMLDGQEINEILYTGSQFGHHILVSQIERVEIIRGPGSALYGGSAELAVVNVVTRGGKELSGASVMGRYAQGETGFHDWSLGASVGGKHESKSLEWSLHAVGGQGRRSRGTFDDFYGNSASLADDQLDPFFMTAGLTYKGLKARLLYDDQTIGATVGFGEAVPGAKLRFRTALADLSYEMKLSETVTLKPRLNARLHIPWQSLDDTTDLFYDKSAVRVLAGVTASWTAASFLTVSGGVEGFVDHAWLNDTRAIGAQTTFGDDNQVSYGNVAGWVQGQLNTPFVNVTAGGRLEWHSRVGVNVAPRLALTRQFERVNVKLLYGGAFRSPGIENLNLGPGLKAERTHVAEAEVGVELGDVGFVSVNGFYTALVAPITYNYDLVTDEESYRNAGALSTAGAEALLKLRGSRGHLNLSYALAVPVVAEDVDTYLRPDGRTTPTLLGMPTHKLTLWGKLVMNKHLSVGGSAVFLGDRYAFTSATDLLDGTGQIGWVKETLLLTAWLGIDSIGGTGFSAQLGVGNVLDAPVQYVQPYNGGLAPMPGRGREYFVRLSYALEFLK
ncbi:MAG: TonB-dependent receptor plug domain-containing protein [Archangium sp.]|nr:TonB-dependent receptor plug domain-containing protein [Archangium sp.]MDP3572552.1 TonB-dependent receptor plug domain-containing protein [Archangium sp.]